MVGVGVYLLAHYGAVLFLAAPLAMGATASAIFSHGGAAGAARTVPIALAPLALAGIVLVALPWRVSSA